MSHFPKIRSLKVSRRALLRSASLVAFGAATSIPFSTGALAQRRGGPSEVPVEELMKPGPLPDLALGSPDAKVIIVEYASMTCPHCATFHNTVLPELKTKYIDTGQVRLVFREFPLDNLAAAGSMLARCAGDNAFAMLEVLFQKQNEWVVRDDPVSKLFDMAKQAGFTKESFEKCLTDDELLSQVEAVRTRANEQFGVSSTPTFFVNGKRLAGGGSMSDFDRALEPLLNG